MIFCNNILELFLIFYLFFICFISDMSVKSSVLPEAIVPDLYSKYKEAVLEENLNTSLRRLLKKDKEYEIHVKKLKEVNGLKRHNLLIKGHLRTGENTKSNPLIYINNPVESKIPKAYLTLEEFKEVLVNRIQQQRNEMTTKNATTLFTIAKTASRNGKTNPMKDPLKSLSKNVTRVLTTLNTKKQDLKNADVAKNISLTLVDVTTEKPSRLKTKAAETDKTIVTIESTIKLDKTNLPKENAKEIESALPLKVTMETININLTLNNDSEPNNESINLTTVENNTELDIYPKENTTISDIDRTSINSELLNASELLKDSETEAKDALTETFDTENEKQSTNSFKSFDNMTSFSGEISPSDYETMTTNELTTNEAENTTIAPVEVSTRQVSRKMVKPKRTTSAKATLEVSKKRSTLSRPLVFMGSR